MRILVLFYSHGGNNRRFARRLAARLDAEIAEVRPKGWRTVLSIVRDMSRDRRPAIRPIAVRAEDFDHLVLVAPVWDMKVANPMLTAIEGLKGRIRRYSFATLCGYHREGQAQALAEQLAATIGHPPALVQEAFVGDLLPESDRTRVLKVSGHRVTEDEVARFDAEIEAIADGLRL